MKKMRKILSGVLALAMLGSMGISVSAVTEDELLDEMTGIYEEEAENVTIPDDYYLTVPDNLPDIESIEELKAYYESIGYTSELGGNYLVDDEFLIKSDFARYKAMKERYGYDIASTLTAPDGTVIVTRLDIGIRGATIALGEKYDDYMHYIIYNGEAYITGSTEFDVNLTEYTIPDEIEGCPVVAIGGSIFRSFPNIESVTIPNTVRTIGAGTFRINMVTGLMELKEVKMAHPDQPSDLQTIGACAFAGCAYLENFEGIKNSDISYIGVRAFYDCARLRDVFLPNNDIEICEDAFNGAYIFLEEVNETGKYVIPSKPFKRMLYDAETEERLARYLADKPDATEAEINELRYEAAFATYCNRLGIFAELFRNGCWVSEKFDEKGNVVAERAFERDFEYKKDIQFADGDIFEVDGDINFDGKVGSADITMVKKYVLNGNKTASDSTEETEILSTMQRFAASVDNSTNVDVKSLIKIKRAALQ